MNTTARIAGTAAIAIVSLLAGMRLSPQDPAKAPQDPAKPKSTAAERFEAAQAIMKQAEDARVSSVQVPWERAAEVDTRVLWSRRFAEAAIDAGEAKARDAYAKHLERTETLFRESKELYEAGRRTGIDVALLRFHVAEAKALVERAK